MRRHETTIVKKRLNDVIMCLCVAACLTSGCSKFRGSRTMDMSPFAENTSMMFAEAADVGRRFRTIYLTPYMNVQEVEDIRNHAVPVLKGLRGLLLYSNQLVALNMSAKSDRDKNALLADYLSQATTRVGGVDKMAKIGVSTAVFDSTLASIRAAKTFLDGIDAASPVINAFVLALLDGLDMLHAEMPVGTGAVERGIESEYRAKRTAYERLTRQHAQYLLAATWLYNIRSGSSTAVDSLLHMDPSLRTFMSAPDRFTKTELDEAEKDLVGRLERIDILIRQLADEKAEYMETMRELQNLRINADRRIKLARDAVVVWGQTHRNLGSGIAVPPMVDLKAWASGAAKSAVSAFP
jgi:hypothetical protein